MKTMLLAAATLLLGACVGRAVDDEGPAAAEPRAHDIEARSHDRAEASLLDASGRNVASADLTPAGEGVRIRLAATTMAPGAYGAHVHTIGRCDGPDFTSAGAHWNPTVAQHGRENPAGAHLGDLPNLIVGTDGRGSVELVIAGASLGGRARDLLDADGSAVLIHARPDDYRTDPSGNSGARIACGVIR